MEGRVLLQNESIVLYQLLLVAALQMKERDGGFTSQSIVVGRLVLVLESRSRPVNSLRET